MNIEDIKRSLRTRDSGPLVNFQERPSKDFMVQRGPPPEIPPNPQRGPPKGVIGLKEIVNRQYDPYSSEEEIIPNSEIWDPPPFGGSGGGSEVVDPYIDINVFIEKTRLNDPEDDWRIKTKKGRKSREHFTKYLVGLL